MIRLFLMLFVLLTPALAVDPGEALSDPMLEQRARALSADLRCPVCQNQSIDDSDAPLARDLRLLIRARLVAGDTDRQVLDYVTARYGEFTLLKPSVSPKNGLLWLAPLIFILLGAGLVWRRTRANIKKN